MSDTLRQHYEAFPYPSRDPEEERKRLITGTPSAVLQIQHYIFGGKLPERPLRFLAAGGGTGDAALMMAQQAVDLGLKAEVLHLDLSAASQEIARKRAEIRGLTNIRFVQDTLLNAAHYGPFDYIDCCGVLHHLDSPPAGLAALKAALTPEGGMGLMLYAPLGRTGVYPMQAALRRITTADMDGQTKVRLARKLIAELPASNWLKRNPLITDHTGSDAGVYDLLLHSQDRAYSVMEVVEFVQGGGLDIISFVEKMRYDPLTFLTSPDLVSHLPEDRYQRAALAEEIGGMLLKHVFYITFKERAASAEAQNSPDMIPIYSGFDGQEIGRSIKPEQALTGKLNGISVAMPMPRLAGAIMQRIDGQRSWRQIHELMQTDLGRDAPSWEKFWEQALEVWHKLHGLNVLLLQRAN